MEIKDLMTEQELSQYEKFESALEPLRKMCNTLNHELGCEASKLLCKIINEMNSMKDVVLLRGKGKLAYNSENDYYYTDEYFSEAFTGVGYYNSESNSFYKDDNVAELVCYFKNGKLIAQNISRNVSKYVFDNSWYCIMEHGLNNILFNLGCENPVVILLDTCNVSFKIKNPISQLSYFLEYFDEVSPLGYRNEIIPMQAKQWEKSMR